MTPSQAGARVIAGGVLLHLALGTLYSWGCIQPYVASYVRLYNPLVTTEDTSMIYAAATLGHSITMPLVGLLQVNLGLRGCAAFGAGLVALATLASSLVKTVARLSVLNAIFGVGIAFAYTCPLVSGYAWMPDRKGTVSGFVVAGFGAGAAVFNVVATAWVNPNNISPDPLTGYYDAEVAGRVPGMYVVLGTCYLVVGMLGSWMLSPPPMDFAKGIADGYASLDSGGPASPATSGDTNNVEVSYGGITSPLCTSEDRVSHSHAVDSREEHVASQLLLAKDKREERLEMTAVSAEMEASETSLVSVITTPLSSGGRLGQTRSGSVSIRQIARTTRVLELLMKMACACARARERRVARGKKSSGNFEVWDLIRELDFYHLSICMMLTAVAGLFIAGNYKRVAQKHFADADHFLSVLGSVASLFNASGRIIGGLAVDRCGCFATLLFVSVGMTGLLVALGLAPETRASFFPIVCLLHMLYGSNFAVYPALTAEMFGATTAGPNYGLVFMGYGIGSFLVMLWLAAVTESSHMFLLCAGCSFLGAVSVALLWIRRRRLKY